MALTSKKKRKLNKSIATVCPKYQHDVFKSNIYSSLINSVPTNNTIQDFLHVLNLFTENYTKDEIKVHLVILRLNNVFLFKQIGNMLLLRDYNMLFAEIKLLSIKSNLNTNYILSELEYRIKYNILGDNEISNPVVKLSDVPKINDTILNSLNKNDKRDELSLGNMVMSGKEKKEKLNLIKPPLLSQYDTKVNDIENINFEMIKHFTSSKSGNGEKFIKNRTLIYILQCGKCAISGEPLKPDFTEVHHIIPTHMQHNSVPNNEISNLILVNGVVHDMIHKKFDNRLYTIQDIKTELKALCFDLKILDYNLSFVNNKFITILNNYRISAGMDIISVIM